MALPTIAEVARVVADPELRYTQAGKAVASVRLAFNKPKYDQQAQKWIDDKTFFIKGTVWEDAAERASQQLAKGARVFVTGDLDTQEWEQDGQKRSAPALTIRRIEGIPRSDPPPPPTPPLSRRGGRWMPKQSGAGAGGGVQGPAAPQPGSGTRPPPSSRGSTSRRFELLETTRNSCE